MPSRGRHKAGFLDGERRTVIWQDTQPGNALPVFSPDDKRFELEGTAAEHPNGGILNMGRLSHPDPGGPPDRTSIEVGEIWENPVTRERATIVERPWDNPESRAAAELTALVGARVVGEHRHPALVERFTVLEGELTVKRDGQISILHQGETSVIEPNVWHDWWNAADRDARVRVEVTPGERFVHMVETLFGLARLGCTNDRGMPHPLQLALIAREFSDVIVFRSPPIAVQRAVFGVLARIAYRRGYRATYPQLSRIVLAPRTVRSSSSPL